jgi:hypothetical protein
MSVLVTRRMRLVMLLTAIVSLLAAADATTALAEPGTNGPLRPVTGEGSGFVAVSPTSQDRPGFHVQVEISVHNLAPMTTYYVERTPDLVPDGDCAGTTWIPTAEITTSAGGAGAVHVEKTPADLPPIFQSGLRFDIQFRVRNQDSSTMLVTDCLTVTAK